MIAMQETSDSTEKIASQLIQRMSLFQDMPLTFNALVIEKTARCNAQCAMCYQSAGPRGSAEIGDVEIAVADLLPVIDSAAHDPHIQSRLHLTGGEAFMKLNDCLILFERAKAAGFLDITSTTNAFWAKKPKNALAICRDLHSAGVTGLEVSWDFWHKPFIPVEAINNCLMASAQYGIGVNLRLLTTKNHSIEEALEGLDQKALSRAARISSGPVFPNGRASRDLDQKSLFKSGTLDDNCHTSLNLTVNAAGDVFPCCAGLDQTSNLRFGNIRTASIADIAASMNKSLLIRTIVFHGISALLPILERAGLTLDRKNYNSICNLCWSIFKEPEHVAAILAHFSRLESEAVENAIAALEKQYPALAGVAG
jgi:organic radical activating enzyme